MEIVIHPCYQVVLKCAFDELMEEIGWQKDMNISTWKSMGKWLKAQLVWDKECWMERLAMTSLLIPYFSQTIPRSKHFIMKSVLSCHRRWISLKLPSRSFGLASHLKSWLASINIRKWWRQRYILWTPALNNSRQPNLFRIISNIWPKAVNCSPKMTIRAMDNLWGGHSWSKWLKNPC